MVGSVPVAGPQSGSVTAFDRTRGLGTVVDESGTAYDFHATAIADGSRTIEPGTAVTFVVAPGRRGRYEARSLSPEAAGSDSHHRPA